MSDFAEPGSTKRAADRLRLAGNAHGRVVLLDAAANVMGSMDKLAAHRGAHPHLAFSVVLFDADGAVLLQQRARGKYHFAGRWSNACCSHPRPGEPVEAAARRRVAEELGIDSGALRVHGAFWYRAHDEVSGLTEHEYDVVLVGRIEHPPDPDPVEVADVELRDPAAARAACEADPDRYTPWLAQVLDIALAEPTPVADGVTVAPGPDDGQ